MNSLFTAICDGCGRTAQVHTRTTIKSCDGCAGWFRVPAAEPAAVTAIEDAKLFRLTAIIASIRCTAAWLDNGGAAVYASEQLRKEAKRLEELFGICNDGVRTDAAPVVGVLASEVRK